MKRRERRPTNLPNEGQLSALTLDLDAPYQEGDLVRIVVVARVSAVSVGTRRAHVLKALEAGVHAQAT